MAALRGGLIRADGICTVTSKARHAASLDVASAREIVLAGPSRAMGHHGQELGGRPAECGAERPAVLQALRRLYAVVLTGPDADMTH